MSRTCKKVQIIPKEWSKNWGLIFIFLTKLLSRITLFGHKGTFTKSPHLQYYWKQQLKSKIILATHQRLCLSIIMVYLCLEVSLKVRYQNRTFYWKIFTWWFCSFWTKLHKRKCSTVISSQELKVTELKRKMETCNFRKILLSCCTMDCCNHRLKS